MRRFRGAVLVVVLAVLLAAAPAGAVSTEPAYPGDFPDPFVLVSGGGYWAYSTGSAGRNLQAMSSSDLRTWTAPVDPLPVLPSWARPGWTWAPGVLPIGGVFRMYYTVRDGASGRQCISVATAASPAGPFTDASTGPLVCQLTNGGSIDPSPFVGPSGVYLHWKSDDNALGRPTYLWAQQLSTDGLSLVGTRALLLRQDRSWQAPVIEGPSMYASGGLHYLFYGAGDWSSANASIGYAWCTSPLGPCANMSASGPWMASHGQAIGPSGPALFRDAVGSPRIAYHAWNGTPGYQNGSVRSLWVDALRFSWGRPVVV
jgi:beta-xylosidase